jgi:hypothetical protein
MSLFPEKVRFGDVLSIKKAVERRQKSTEIIPVPVDPLLYGEYFILSISFESTTIVAISFLIS